MNPKIRRNNAPTSHTEPAGDARPAHGTNRSVTHADSAVVPEVQIDPEVVETAATQVARAARWLIDVDWAPDQDAVADVLAILDAAAHACATPSPRGAPAPREARRALTKALFALFRYAHPLFLGRGHLDRDAVDQLRLLAAGAVGAANQYAAALEAHGSRRAVDDGRSS